jgi:hypothetical protein
MMEIYVFHFNGEVDLVEIHADKRSSKAVDKIKSMLLNEFPDIRCRIIIP